MNIVSREDSIYIHVFVQLKEIFSISIIAYIQEARLVEPLASGHKVRLRLSRVSKTPHPPSQWGSVGFRFLSRSVFKLEHNKLDTKVKLFLVNLI